MSDWLQIDDFKRKIIELKNNGYVFISLQECYLKLSHDVLRLKKYAVITFDDGYYSLKEILPWLIENKTPVTLFINGKYLDGKSYRVNSSERYLTREDLFSLKSAYIEIGNHGWEHTDSTLIKMNDFETSISNNLNILSAHPRYVPFWAYTWGKYNDMTNDLLNRYELMPVLMDGSVNFTGTRCIHRENLY